LVFQSTNAQEIVNICCCCGCCCALLRTIKRHPKPNTLVSTPFLVTADTETCEGCNICVERCQMEALSLDNGKVLLDADRCIGCGLCVSTCPTGSLRLVRKPDSEQRKVPKDMFETFYRLGQARGKIGPVKMLKMVLKSKKDSLLASR